MRCVVCIILLALSTCLKAQKLNITYTHLTPRDGLAGSQVYCALQDHQGYIWFGTETGVSRYNGRRFENFYTGDGLSDNEVFLMFQDSQHRIWFSTLNGQPSFYLNGKFHNASNTAWMKDLSFGGHFGSAFEDSRGDLWFAMQRKGVVRITADNRIFKHGFRELFNGQLLSFKEKEGETWVMHSISGELNLSALDSGANIPVDVHAEIPSRQMIGNYLGTRSSILVTGKHLFGSYLKGVDLKGNEIGLSKMQHYEDELWLNTYYGVYHLDRNSMQEKGRYFQDKIVTHVLKDREGGYWFTTLGDGVYWSSSISSRSLTNEQSDLLNGVSTLNWEGEHLLFGGSGALVGTLSQGRAQLEQAEQVINRAMIKTIEKGNLPGQYILGSDNMLMEVVHGKINRLQEMNAKLVRRIDRGLWAVYERSLCHHCE